MNALRSLREYFQAVDARGGWQTEERPNEAGDTGVEAGDGGDDVPAESGASRSRTSTRGSTRGKSTQTLTEVIAAVTTSAKKGKAEATSTNTNDPDGRRFDERLRKKFPYGPYVWFENSARAPEDWRPIEWDVASVNGQGVSIAATDLWGSRTRGRKRVIQIHFNVSVLEAIFERKASTL